MKILGILILLCSGIGIASVLLREDERVLVRTRSWLEFLMFVRGAVDNYSMSVTEILRSCDKDLLIRLGYPQDSPLPESLAELVRYGDIPDRECRESIETLVNDFGKSYRAHQVSRCDDCIERLRAREEDISRMLPTRKRIILSISLCATIVVLILLL